MGTLVGQGMCGWGKKKEKKKIENVGTNLKKKYYEIQHDHSSLQSIRNVCV